MFLATVKDYSYGLLAEAIKHSIGEQHEQIIKDRFKELSIPFVDEHVRRSKSYDKTSDVKFEIPVAVNGKVINWIESNALFGDSAAHEGYLRVQLHLSMRGIVLMDRFRGIRELADSHFRLEFIIFKFLNLIILIKSV